MAELDARGLNCPMPILRAKKALKDVAAGDTLKVLATDPGSVNDFESFCRTTGNELVKTPPSSLVSTNSLPHHRQRVGGDERGGRRLHLCDSQGRLRPLSPHSPDDALF